MSAVGGGPHVHANRGIAWKEIPQIAATSGGFGTTIIGSAALAFGYGSVFTDSIPSRDTSRSLVDGPAAVHVGAEGGGTGDRAAGCRTRDGLARGVWIAVAILLVLILWSVINLARGDVTLSPLKAAPYFPSILGWPSIDAVLAILIGFALALPVAGGNEVLVRGAHELPPPRVQALRRTSLLSVLFAGLVTAPGTFFIVLLIPASEHPV